MSVQSSPRDETAAGDPVDELIALSHRFGDDPEFARGGGGNSSVKLGGALLIKPSGTSLAALRRESLIALEPGPLLELLEAEPTAPAAGGPDGAATAPVAGGTDAVMEVALRARIGAADGRRPSVECLFHALLPQRFVLHTHPTTVNALTCATRGAEIAAELFGDEVLWVRYTDPGLPLARAIQAAVRRHEQRTGGPAPRAILLQNHGLVVAGDSSAEVEATSVRLLETIRARLAETQRPSPDLAEPADPAVAARALRILAPSLRALLASGDRLKVVAFDGSPASLAAATLPHARELARRGPLTPDQIVYAGSFPLAVDAPLDADPAALVEALRASLGARAQAGLEPPHVVLVRGLGLFAVGDSSAQADLVCEVYVDALTVTEGAERLGGVRALSDAERGFIERWEAEAYRRGVAAGTAVAGRARGLVAVVTGAAQGFGQAIAAGLVAEGAHVVFADLNVELATHEAESLESAFGPGRAIAIGLDVTDDASVGACFDAVVRRYGGFDLLVSNAGILRAGSVMSQPVAEFDAVTRVNYRGYFLCVRHAAPILARQHAARPEYLSDIVEINSKSGLEGSSRNSAYAGSKFGGIGLTESFALELVDDGIKVNAICPGNFLDGPLWSDPERGLFVQYLREGKVPGARTVDDVRRFYESKVPMGRGCMPADVLEALYYVVAQRYETGQAIAVTGGQVMLR